MGFGRLLTILIIIGLGYYFYKRFIAGTKKPKPPAEKSVEKAVRCTYCQLHIPEHEAISHHGRYYCSQQHLELDRNRQT
jgi:uncharacterized protein